MKLKLGCKINKQINEFIKQILNGKEGGGGGRERGETSGFIFFFSV